MADPVNVTDFWNLIIPYMEVRKPMKLNSRVNTSNVGTGQMLVVDIGPRYWTGSYKFRELKTATARMIQTLIEDFSSGVQTFYAYDPIMNNPPDDPTGSKLAGNVNAPVNFLSVGGDGSSLRIQGLPANFTISQGWMMHFGYGTGGNAYRALHRFKTTVQANSSGVTANIPVNPAFDDPTIAAGKVITLQKPAGKFRMVPGSFDEGEHTGVFTSGMGFDIEQVP